MNAGNAPTRRALVFFLLFAAAFAAVAVLARSKRLAGFDAAVIRAVQGWENKALTAAMKFFTAIGTGLPVVIVTALILFILFKILHHRGELLFFLITVIGSSVLNTLLKWAFGMPRPDIHRLVKQAGYGFPSGHAMGAATLYGVTAYLVWKHIGTRTGRSLVVTAAAFMILAIGISRIYLGVHYPSDVIGGYLASGCWLSAMVWAYERKKS